MQQISVWDVCFCTQTRRSASPLLSFLFPFLWIWLSNDVCVRAYITRTHAGGVWFPLACPLFALFLPFSPMFSLSQMSQGFGQICRHIHGPCP